MFNVKERQKLKKFMKDLKNKWEEIYREAGYDNISFSIVNGADEWNSNQDSDVPTCTDEELVDAEMTTLMCPLVDDTGIIVNLKAGVVSSYSSLLQVLVMFDLNLDLAERHAFNTLRHELGHITVGVSYIGRSLQEWSEMTRIMKDDHDNLQKLRSNANPKTTFEYILAVHNQTYEKKADEAAGITDKDVAIDFVLANPGYSRSRLGVEKYLTVEEFKEIRSGNY